MRCFDPPARGWSKRGSASIWKIPDLFLNRSLPQVWGERHQPSWRDRPGGWQWRTSSHYGWCRSARWLCPQPTERERVRHHAASPALTWSHFFSWFGLQVLLKLTLQRLSWTVWHCSSLFTSQISSLTVLHSSSSTVSHTSSYTVWQEGPADMGRINTLGLSADPPHLSRRPPRPPGNRSRWGQTQTQGLRSRRSVFWRGLGTGWWPPVWCQTTPGGQTALTSDFPEWRGETTTRNEIFSQLGTIL